MSDTLLQPYLFFGGRSEEAIEFYKKALHAKVEMLMRYKESPEPSQMPLPPNWDDKVMHEKGFEGFSLSLTTRDEAEAKRMFDALLDGGEVNMPLTKTFFSPAFGMVRDRFGINWMVMVPGEH
jgi:PhnB protein